MKEPLGRRSLKALATDYVKNVQYDLMLRHYVVMGLVEISKTVHLSKC